MKRAAIGIILSVLFCMSLFAQEDPNWFIGKPIAGFQFHGLKTVTEAELLALLDSYKTKPFAYDIYWEMQNRLYSLEFFESVSADAIPGDPEKKSVIVSFQMKERAIVTKIFFSGNANVGEKELRDAILIKEQAVFSEAKLRIDADSIKSVYRGKGFLDAGIAFSFTPLKEENTVEVTFTINEGPKTTVKKIQFSGNTFASEGTLKGLMQIKEPALFVSGDFQESKIKEDSEAIQNYYADHGYYFAKVEKVDKEFELNEAEQRKYIILTFYINEGTQYTYGGTTFQGNKVFSTEKLAAFLRQKPGEIVSKKKFKEDFMQVINIYYDNGYVTTQINAREKVDDGKKEISFEVVIVEGDRSHIGRIIIQGNTKTREYVIRRELPFEEGDIFSKARIQRGYINLMRTGYFSRNIMFEPAPGAQEGLIDLIITVEETSTAQFELGGSVMPSDFPFSAYANIYDKNFLGMGITTGLNLTVTPLQQSLSVFYENGWLFGSRLLGGVSISFKHEIIRNVPQDILGPIFYGNEPDAAPDPFNNLDEYYAALDSGEGIPPEYTMEYHSLQFSLGLSGGYSIETLIGLLGFKLEPSASLSYVTWDRAIHRPFSNLLRSELNQWLLINRLGVTFSLTATDIPHNPENGYYLSQYVGFTGAFLGGNRHYTRLSTEAEYYLTFFSIPVGESGHFKLILALHSQLSFVLPPVFGDMVSVEEDYYRIDGMFVGRGWSLLRQRGKVLWDNKLELRMPIVEEALWWTVFYFDAVGLWLEPQDFATMEIDDFYFSFGTGLRLTIPGIPLRLYFSKRFKTNNGVVEWQEGALKFWEGFSLDFVFSIDINPF